MNLQIFLANQTAYLSQSRVKYYSPNDISDMESKFIF